jgi:hypothetical protein
MPNITLINISTELVDAIVNHIDNPKDVLNSALACKRLYQVIVPDHLEFRHIRCDPRQKDLWDELCQKPGLTAKVRFLELRWTLAMYDQTAPSNYILPRSMRLVPISSAPCGLGPLDFTPLVLAMGHMDSRIRFSWIGFDMPHGIGHLFRAIDNLLSPLKELQLTQEVICHTGLATIDAFPQGCPVSDF